MPLKKPKIQNEEDDEIEEVEELEEEEPEEEQQQIKKAITKPVPVKPKSGSVDKYRIVEVPVQTTTAFEDTETQKVYDQNQMLLRIANDIEEIKKSIA